MLGSEKIRTDRKTFYIDLKENFRGRFFKITEATGGRRSSILVPAETIGEALDKLRSLRDFERTFD